MASKTKEAERPENSLVGGASTLSILDRYKNIILGIAGALVLIGVGYFIYNNFFVKPKNQEAISQIFQAQFMFDQDSFNLALNNPGVGKSGFLKIIEDYKGTETANLAKYYAGICYLNLRDYNNAIKYLTEYKPAGDITPPMTYAALGDAYSEIKEDKKALESYQKAARLANNEVTGPYILKKLALFNEKMGNWQAAADAYEKLRKDYSKTTDASNVEVALERAKLKAAQK